jgi:hypothetical protein
MVHLIILLVVLPVAATTAFAQPPPLKHEGPFWVQTSTGKLSVSQGARLRVKTRGSVVIRGGAGDTVTYVVTNRIKAGNEAEARRLLAYASVLSRQSREWSYLTVATERGGINADLEIRAPKYLREAVIETRGGNVEVYDIDGHVEAESAGGRIQMDRIGSDAIARTGGGEIRLGSVGGSVRCLSAGGSIELERCGGESRFETAGGDVQIVETAGPVHASTEGGNIRIGRAGSSVAAHTAGGRIEVQHANGTVTAENSGGSIHVGTASGVRCESSVGAIRLRGSSGALRAATDSGNILAELVQGAVLQDSSLSTSAGDITVYIPSNMALTIRAQSEGGRGGRIISEFPEVRVQLVNMLHDVSHASGSSAEGAINGGGPVLKISAIGGTIHLRRHIIE